MRINVLKVKKSMQTDKTGQTITPWNIQRSIPLFNALFTFSGEISDVKILVKVEKRKIYHQNYYSCKISWRNPIKYKYYYSACKFLKSIMTYLVKNSSRTAFEAVKFSKSPRKPVIGITQLLMSLPSCDAILHGFFYFGSHAIKILTIDHFQ